MQWEYASEERLAARNAVYRALLREGESAEDVSYEIVRRLAPRRLLEVGCGRGEFAERLVREAAIDVTAIDLSPRMVELSRARGVDAREADVEELPFPDADFDVVVANWVLYHVPNVDRALDEIARVLEPGGQLIAATVGPENMRELWELVGGPVTVERSFDTRAGKERLLRHFESVEQRDVEGMLVFPDAASVRHFVAMTMTRAHLADRVPDIDAPLKTRSRHTIFVARK